MNWIKTEGQKMYGEKGKLYGLTELNIAKLLRQITASLHRNSDWLFQVLYLQLYQCTVLQENVNLYFKYYFFSYK